ncbi:hypothetical protein ACIGBL_26005 [Streptomyces sp. NPDC085614]|uniref:hypothetical protein n=1 Tax=Streptomyces sp. NPDC085614 TaxID=3365733 RepID=UPI0037D8ED11
MTVLTVLTVRPLLSTALAALAAGGVLWTGAPTADAVVGDRGDLKIQRAGTDPDSRADHTRVCQFHLSAFDFETLREIDWEIAPQPRVGAATSGGRITLRGGMGHTADLALPEGRYQLTWTFDGAVETGREKAFRVDCAGYLADPRPADAGGGEAAGAPGANGNAWTGDGGDGGGERGAEPDGAGDGGERGAEADAGAGGGDGAREGGADEAVGAAPRADRGDARPPNGPVGAGGGGSAEVAADDGSAFGAGSALAAGLAGTAVLILVRRSRRRTDGTA